MDEEDFVGSVQQEEQRRLKTISSVKNALTDRFKTRSAKVSLDVVREDSDEEGKEYDIRQELFERTATTPYPHSEKFQRLVVAGDVDVDQDVVLACKCLDKGMELRMKWISQFPLSSLEHSSEAIKPSYSIHHTKGPNPISFRRRDPLEYRVFEKPLPPSCADEFLTEMDKGVMRVIRRHHDDEVSISKKSRVFDVFSFDEFTQDFYQLRKAVYSGPVISYSYRQLEILQAKFSIHVLLNGDRETDAQKSVPHRDFYNVRKVDTHVHHSACMNQKHLLRFIKHKLKNRPNDVVIYRDDKYLTLGEVFKSLHLTAYDLSIDTLDMHAHTTFERFDRFNLKYNPAGQSRLREIFLKTDNHIEGAYLAEITKEVISDLEASKYQLVEWRLSIYGRRAEEWTKLAKWFYTHRLAHPNVRWMIQVPRLYHVYKASGEINNFQDMLSNIFGPLFAITLDASSDPALFYFLETVVGFDSVDDESRPVNFRLSDALPSPDGWDRAENPPYEYWMYYMHANIFTLSQLRASQGLSTFEFRPHCGEAGDLDHLLANYLLAHQINHGM